MDGETALAVLRYQATRMSQSELADQVTVSEATISRWLSAKTPPSRGLSKLVAWAEQLPSGPPSPDVMTAAIQRTTENLFKLGEIRGQAKGVLAMPSARISRLRRSAMQA